MKKKAFTLAEVLITLGIIGVVAALTMPSLIANYQKQQTITQLKKAYTTLSNGFQQMTVDDVLLPPYGDDCSSVTSEEFLNTYIRPYFKVIKTCTEADNNNCGYPAGFTWLSPDGTYRSMGMYNFGIDDVRAGITLADGTFILFRHKDSNNTGCYLNAFIDLNGPKAPNTLGKDVFSVLFHDNNTIVPMYFTDTNDITGNEITARGCYKGGWGVHCLYKIVSDGWQIKDDYPW